MDVAKLLENNKLWAKKTSEEKPELFATLAKQQSPKYLWIGCADSRVPANEIVGLMPGELFVHRNVGNLVKHVDFNCQAVIQYAVNVLTVENIIVCGHYECGGIKVAMSNVNAGISDYWLRSVKDHFWLNQKELQKIDSEEGRLNKMCEINVIRQVSNLSRSKIVQTAWQKGQKLRIHGWIYSINDGVIHDLEVGRHGFKEEEGIYEPNKNKF